MLVNHRIIWVFKRSPKGAYIGLDILAGTKLIFLRKWRFFVTHGGPNWPSWQSEVFSCSRGGPNWLSWGSAHSFPLQLGPQMTLFRKCPFSFTHAGPQLTLLRKCLFSFTHTLNWPSWGSAHFFYSWGAPSQNTSQTSTTKWESDNFRDKQKDRHRHIKGSDDFSLLTLFLTHRGSQLTF